MNRQARNPYWRGWLLVAATLWMTVAPAVHAAGLPRFFAEPASVGGEGSSAGPGLHKYLYAHANPIMGSDPSGRSMLVNFYYGMGAWATINASAIATISMNVAITATAAYIWTGNLISYEETFGDGASDGLYALQALEAQIFFISAGMFEASVALAPRPPAQRSTPPSKTIYVSRSRYPESAKHIDDAQDAGKPAILTVDRTSKAARRAAALAETQRVAGMDRDEYPPAVFREGGAGASIRLIPPPDNRGSGSTIGHQLKGVADGTIVELKTKE